MNIMGEETRRIVTARKRSLGQGNIFSSVCQEFCSQGGSVSVHAGIPPQEQTPPGTRNKHPPPGVDNPLGPGTLPKSRPPGEQTPPRSRHPQEQTPPVQYMLGDTVKKRAVCILLECNLVRIEFFGKVSIPQFSVADPGSPRWGHQPERGETLEECTLNFKSASIIQGINGC